MADADQLLYAAEVHSVEGIRQYFNDGGGPNDVLPGGMPAFKMLVEMYTRTSRFKDCVQEFINAGLVFDDEALLAVFTDDDAKLEELIAADPALTGKTYSLYNNTYTPLT